MILELTVSIFEDIATQRSVGGVRCGASEHSSVEEVAVQFGLRGTSIDQRIFYDAARQLLVEPATGATFDTGVLAISKLGSACLWVKDED
jgi:hypothetical protein